MGQLELKAATLSGRNRSASVRKNKLAFGRGGDWLRGCGETVHRAGTLFEPGQALRDGAGEGDARVARRPG